MPHRADDSGSTDLYGADLNVYNVIFTDGEEKRFGCSQCCLDTQTSDA